MLKTQIESILAREVLDSRGNPTVEAEVCLACGVTCTAIAPSGASTGTYEAVELRDRDMQRYHGLGVKTACKHVCGEIADALHGMDAADLTEIDHALLALDATPDRSHLGANALLSVSMACAKAAAAAQDLSLFRFLGGAQALTLPLPLMNIINGGAHAPNGLDIQEFMILPVGAERFSDALRMGAEVYHALSALLKKKGIACGVGDEGGFAPPLDHETQALDLLLEAIARAGYTPGTDIALGLDAAAGEWQQDGGYRMPKSGRTYTAQQLIDHYASLVSRYPIRSLEDPLGEDDFTAWQHITQRLGKTVQLVGDDLFVTHPDRLQKGIALHCANAVLIKPNQVGTLTQAIRTAQIARQHGLAAILSHRSGDTEDTLIADLSVALGTGQIKTGAPCRSERVCKYNRLLRIEDALGIGAVFPGAGMMACST